jgi:hypothetical protein
MPFLQGEWFGFNMAEKKSGMPGTRMPTARMPGIGLPFLKRKARVLIYD